MDKSLTGSPVIIVTPMFQISSLRQILSSRSSCLRCPSILLSVTHLTDSHRQAIRQILENQSAVCQFLNDILFP